MLVAILLACSPVAGQDVPPLEYPIFLAAGPEGGVYVSDQNVPAVFRIDAAGKRTVVFRGSRQQRSTLNRPRGLCAAGDGTLYVCDPATYDVYRLTDGRPEALTGKPVKLLDGRTQSLGELVNPEGVVVLAEGVVAVSDLRQRAIFRIKDGKPEKWADVPAPHGMAVDADGGVVVVSHGDDQLVRVSPTGEVAPVVAGRPFEFPLSVARLSEGGYLVTDNYADCIWKVAADGAVEKWLTDERLANPTGIAVAKDDTVYVADPHRKAIYRIDAERKLVPFGQ